MGREEALVFAYQFDGEGNAQAVNWPDLRLGDRAGGWLWVHLDRGAPEARQWLSEADGLDPLVRDALLEEEVRPRCSVTSNGLLLILRGVNLNPGADPEDMVALRIWVEAGLVVTTRHRRLLAVQDVEETIVAGRGPKTPGEFIVDLADNLVERMGPVIDNLDEQIDLIEEEMISAYERQLRFRLAAFRRQAILLRRYIAPQREALSQLMTAKLDLFDDWQRARLREVSDKVTRYVEELDSARERATVVQDELAGRLSDDLNRKMYVLTVIAGIFLPLGFVTGLLGINVGGIPGTEAPWGFALVCALLLLLGLSEYWLFRWLKWL